LLRLSRQWRTAGILEPEGPGSHPETGTPQGGVGSPGLANGSLPSALDRWCTQGGKPRWRGAAWLCRDADAGVGAVRSQDAAARCSRVLPKRREQCHRQGAPEQTQRLRCSRVHPRMRRCGTCLGGAFPWTPERHGVSRVTRRTARQQLQAACQRITEGIIPPRPLPGRECFQRRHARRRGHDHDSGVRGNSRARHRCCKWAMDGTLQWLNRRSGTRQSETGEQCPRVLDRGKRARPCITEVRRRRGLA
jgi:RNA-directed DNA polymerase